jgi:SAM-dependent methyltransferase
MAAKLRPGECVVDLGAGTGLLAVAARRRLPASGSVLALDISFDALAEGRRQAAAPPPGAAVGWAVADAVRLPLADQSVGNRSEGGNLSGKKRWRGKRQQRRRWLFTDRCSTGRRQIVQYVPALLP